MSACISFAIKDTLKTHSQSCTEVLEMTCSVWFFLIFNVFDFSSFFNLGITNFYWIEFYVSHTLHILQCSPGNALNYVDLRFGICLLFVSRVWEQIYFFTPIAGLKCGPKPHFDKVVTKHFPLSYFHLSIVDLSCILKTYLLLLLENVKLLTFICETALEQDHANDVWDHL